VPALDGVPGDALLFSNRPSVVYGRTLRPTLMLPQATIGSSGDPNPREDESWDELVELTRDRPVLIALAKSDFAMPGFVARMDRHLTTEQVADLPEFVVLRARPRS
jgi:hypothetical protein